METKKATGSTEKKFEEGTFGHLVEQYSPPGLAMRAKLDGDTSESYKETFADMKMNFLALCSNPNVMISPLQKEFINKFLYKIYQFPQGKILTGEEWVKVDQERQLVLATYINSLH